MHTTEKFITYNLFQLDLLADIAVNASNMSRQQEDLAMITSLLVEEAHNISAMALATLCQAIDIHNATSDLIRQLSSHDAVNVMTLQQQIDSLVMQIQQAISEHNVFNTSQLLVDKAANISIPLFDVGLVDSMVHDVVQNVTNLYANVNKSLDQLEILEEQASDLNSTAEELLQRGRQLTEEADVLFRSLNELLFRTTQNITTAQVHFDNLTALHINLTATSRLFNGNFTDVKTRLEEAENITKVAHPLSVDGQEDVKHIQQLINVTMESLDNSNRQLTDDNTTLTAVSVCFTCVIAMDSVLTRVCNMR